MKFFLKNSILAQTFCSCKLSTLHHCGYIKTNSIDFEEKFYKKILFFSGSSMHRSPLADIFVIVLKSGYIKILSWIINET